MKIVYDNIVFSLQKSGGISVAWYELLFRILKTDAEVSFIEYENSKENFFRKNIDVPQNLIQKRKLYFLGIYRYLNLFRKGKNRIIFHSSYYRIINKPEVLNVTTVHDFTYEYYRSGLAKLIHHLQKKYAIEKADIVLCVSEYTKFDVLKFFPNVPESKIKVIYNGVSEDFYRLDSKSLNAENLFTKNSYLLYVGDRKSKHKNFVQMIKSFPKDFNLVLVGGGPILKDEQDLLTKHFNPNSYYFVGGIENEVLNSLYNNAFALIYPSLYEGFGIPIIEANKAGCPVISTAYSSIPEIAGNAAILVDEVTTKSLESAVNRLKSADYRDEIISKGINNAKRFSWDKYFNEIYKVYQDLWEV